MPLTTKFVQIASEKTHTLVRLEPVNVKLEAQRFNHRAKESIPLNSFQRFNLYYLYLFVLTSGV